MRNWTDRRIEVLFLWDHLKKNAITHWGNLISIVGNEKLILFCLYYYFWICLKIEHKASMTGIYK